MHDHTIEPWTHDHSFLGEAHERNERRTLAVVALTAATMLAEIVGGTIFHSMALIADGWHMSTHVLALGVAALAYRFARRHRGDPRFSFGTGKFGELAAFASALMLGTVGLLVAYESLTRLLAPTPIAYREAIPIATLGLLVNVASAALLHGGGHHHAAHRHGNDDGDPHDHRLPHTHDDRHGHRHGGLHGDDTNMSAAYIHVLADALTSLLAIAALSAAALLGWTWLDPAVGLVGTVVIVAWAVSLIRKSGAALLDIVPSSEIEAAVRDAVETNGDRVADLHLWRLGPGHAGVILSIVTDHPTEPSDYKRRLAAIPGLSHVTVEVNRCPSHAVAA